MVVARAGGRSNEAARLLVYVEVLRVRAVGELKQPIGFVPLPFFPVAAAWLWIIVLRFVLLGLQPTFATSSALPELARRVIETWFDPTGMPSFARRAAYINTLLTIWLWASFRSYVIARHQWPGRAAVAWVGTAALLLYLQWAILKVTGMRPYWDLIQIYP